MTRVYAHRGDSQAYPENTLLAFRKALESGAYGIELDLHSTSDGTVVVIHDRSLERTTTGRGYVDEQPLAVIREFDAGSGERVPTFAEVLDLVGDRMHFDLEVKQPGIESEVLDVLARYPATRWAISSFDWGILDRIRQLAPKAELWPLAMRVDEALLAEAAGQVNLVSDSSVQGTELRGMVRIGWLRGALDVGGGAGLGELAPAFGGTVHRVVEGLDDQRLAGIEMGVEPAMGQPRLLHQVGDADAVSALLAQPHRGLAHDAGVGFLLVFPGVTHGPSITCLWSYNSMLPAKKLLLFAVFRPDHGKRRSSVHREIAGAVAHETFGVAGPAAEFYQLALGLDRAGLD